MPTAPRTARVTCGMAAVVTLASCGSVRDPWRGVEEPTRVEIERHLARTMCEVRFENGTGERLEMQYQAGRAGLSGRLGTVDPGQSVRLGVQCGEQIISAYGVAPFRIGEGFPRYHQVAELDVLEETVVKLTVADRMR